MRKSWYLLILFTLLTVAGCALFEPKVNESGQTYTDIENYMKIAGGLLIGVGCFMAGFGIAIILCAAKDREVNRINNIDNMESQQNEEESL